MFGSYDSIKLTGISIFLAGNDSIKLTGISMHLAGMTALN
jgi:hypothetical protein